jgi:hypothetical protein
MSRPSRMTLFRAARGAHRLSATPDANEPDQRDGTLAPTLAPPSLFRDRSRAPTKSTTDARASPFRRAPRAYSA